MNLKSIIDYVTMKHKGQFRKDGETPYVNHPFKVCDELYRLGLTNQDWHTEKISYYDYMIYATALCHDVLEDTETTYHDMIDEVGEPIATRVQRLSFINNEKEVNPFAKAGYLRSICTADNDVFYIKVIDRLCNVRDFIASGDLHYAKIYFHKADMLFDEAYNREKIKKDYKLPCNKVYDEVIKVMMELKGNKNGICK